MRKSITSHALIPALAAAALLWMGQASAPVLAADDPAASGMPGAANNDAIQLQENAPDRYVVVKGDTLWSISGKFLKDPWRWPEIWHMNEDQIHNPQRIYPGNIIVLDRSKGQPQLKLATPVLMEKLDPKARVEQVGAIVPSIPPGIIEPFLSRPLIIEKAGLEYSPRIVATQEDRVYLGAGSKAYAVGIDDPKQTLWHVYRPGKALIDPDNRDVLGHEAIYLGTARVTREGNPTTIEIVSSTQEIGRGDRLVPAARALPLSYAPHAPENFLQGRVLEIYGEGTEGGPGSIIAISRGTRDGVEIGDVLALYRYGKYFDDTAPTKSNQPAPKPSAMAEGASFSSGAGPTPTQKSTGSKTVRLKMPDERYGLVFVFRVFDRVSYALVMDVSRPVLSNDVVQSP